MRYVGLFVALVLAGFALVAGCDSDNETNGGGTLLAQGTITVPASGSVDLVTVEVTAPGTVRGTITWSGAPTELGAVFRHIASGDFHGLTQSPSPLTSTTAVTSTDVAAGTQWLFRAGNTGAAAVSVQYTVTFTPQ